MFTLVMIRCARGYSIDSIESEDNYLRCSQREVPGSDCVHSNVLPKLCTECTPTLLSFFLLVQLIQALLSVCHLNNNDTNQVDHPPRSIKA